MAGEWIHKIFSGKDRDFKEKALEIFGQQYQDNPVYHAYVNAIGIDPSSVQTPDKIPFLPISFFKTHEIKCGDYIAEAVFESSGTTQSAPSRHFVKDLTVYHESLIRGFENRFGNPADWCIIGLLPSYLERSSSSLVYMVNKLINCGKHPMSGFYLNEYEKLSETLKELEKGNQKTILIGVTFALLDFAEKYAKPLRHTLIMETGGMKGRKEELTRNAVHNILKTAFGKITIHSEYGMTELLSQAYSGGDGIFNCPPWMKILIRNEDDPFEVKLPANNTSVSGAINIIDLANIHSCSFIATDDVGKLNPDGSFEVIGRIDGSDLRGCSLMSV